MSLTVTEAMGRIFQSLKRSDTVGEAKRLIAASESRTLWVMDKKRADGLITDADLIQKEAEDHESVEKIMSSPVLSVRADALLDEAARTMTNNRVSRLAVVAENGDMVGVISERDILKDLVVEQRYPKLSPERVAIYLAMTNERENEEEWLQRAEAEGYKAVITQVGATAEKLPIKLREATIVAAIARNVILEDARDKFALSSAVRDCYSQIAQINPGLGGGFKVAVVRGEGRITACAFGKCGHALANGSNIIVIGTNII